MKYREDICKDICTYNKIFVKCCGYEHQTLIIYFDEGTTMFYAVPTSRVFQLPTDDIYTAIFMEKYLTRF